MSSQFHTLKVAAIDRPIEGATTITFKVPDHLWSSFEYYPGQHLILRVVLNGEELRRSYSINSCPHNENEPLQITVKRVQGGRVSNHINDAVQVGDTVEAMIPQGRFYADVQPDAYKTYFLFAAGSGITPIVSILKSVLLASPNSVVHLLYGNTNQDSIIFKSELDALEQQYPNRLTITHTLSDPKVWTTWQQWKGAKGRIDANAVEAFITNHPPVAQSTEYYVCGPGAMNLSVRKTLLELGVPKELIHIEHFGGADLSAGDAIPAVDATLSVSINGQKRTLQVAKQQTMLQAMKAANIEVPYSCESGVCATCVARLKSGSAEMQSNMALEDGDVAKGQILTCQAWCTSAEVAIEVGA